MKVCKSLDKPDETRTFDHGKVEVVHLENEVVGRLTLEPGWRWSEHVKPVAGTESCEVEHHQVALSGRLHIKTDAGEEFEIGPGDVMFIDPGHDAWVVGSEPFIAIDWTGGEKYAKK